MASNQKLESHARAADRRLHIRQRVLLSCLQLKDNNGGIVLDISERGLSMRTVKSLGDATHTELRFQLSQLDRWFVTRGRIAWTSASKQTAGIEFEDISEESRDSIKSWLSAIDSPEAGEYKYSSGDVISPSKFARRRAEVAPLSLPVPVRSGIVVQEVVEDLVSGISDEILHNFEGHEEHAAAPVLASAVHAERAASPGIALHPSLDAPAEYQADSPAEAPRPMHRLLTHGAFPEEALESRGHAGLWIGAALLLAVVLCVSYFPHKSQNVQPREAVASLPPSLLEVVSTPASAVIPSYKSEVPPPSGFVLQVAALKDEKDAISVADALGHKGYPAYVFKPVTKDVYRVLVGPYPNADSALKIEHKLRQEGFQVIRKPNIPTD